MYVERCLSYLMSKRRLPGRIISDNKDVRRQDAPHIALKSNKRVARGMRNEKTVLQSPYGQNVNLQSQKGHRKTQKKKRTKLTLKK